MLFCFSVESKMPQRPNAASLSQWGQPQAVGGRAALRHAPSGCGSVGTQHSFFTTSFRLLWFGIPGLILGILLGFSSRLRIRELARRLRCDPKTIARTGEATFITNDDAHDADRRRGCFVRTQEVTGAG